MAGCKSGWGSALGRSVFLCEVDGRVTVHREGRGTGGAPGEKRQVGAGEVGMRAHNPWELREDLRGSGWLSHRFSLPGWGWAGLATGAAGS